MRIDELLSEAAVPQQPVHRVPWATPRFLKDIEKEKRYPGVLKQLEKFLKHYETSNNLFNTKDGPLSRPESITPPVRRCHLRLGKIILVYQLTSTAIRLLAIGEHDIIEGKDKDTLIFYVARLTDTDFQQYSPPADVEKPDVIPKKKKIEPLTDAEFKDILSLFKMLKNSPSDVYVLENMANGNIDDFMKWARATINLEPDDTSKDQLIINDLKGKSSMIRWAKKFLGIE